MPPFCSPVEMQGRTYEPEEETQRRESHTTRHDGCTAAATASPAVQQPAAAAAAAAAADPMNSATVGMREPALRLVNLVSPQVPVPRTAKKLVGALMYMSGNACEGEALYSELLARVHTLFSARAGRPASASDAARLIGCWRVQGLPGSLAQAAPHQETVRHALSGQEDDDFVASTATALTQPAFTLLNLLFVHVIDPALVRSQAESGSVRRRRGGSRSPSVSPGLTHSPPPTPGAVPTMSLCGEAEKAEAAEAAAVAAALAVYGMARMQTWDSKDVCQMLSYTVNTEDQLGALKLRVVSVGSAQRRAQTQDKVELRFMPQTEDKRAVVAALLLGLKCVWFNPSWDCEKVRGYARRCARDVALPAQWVAAVEDEAEAVWAQTKALALYCRPHQQPFVRQVPDVLPDATGRAQLKLEVLYRLQQFPDRTERQPSLAGSLLRSSGNMSDADVDVDVGHLAEELNGDFNTPVDPATPASPLALPSVLAEWQRADDNEPAAWSKGRVDAAARRAGHAVAARSQQRSCRRRGCRPQQRRQQLPPSAWTQWGLGGGGPGEGAQGGEKGRGESRLEARREPDVSRAQRALPSLPFLLLLLSL